VLRAGPESWSLDGVEEDGGAEDCEFFDMASTPEVEDGMAFASCEDVFKAGPESCSVLLGGDFGEEEDFEFFDMASTPDVEEGMALAS